MSSRRLDAEIIQQRLHHMKLGQEPKIVQVIAVFEAYIADNHTEGTTQLRGGICTEAQLLECVAWVRAQENRGAIDEMIAALDEGDDPDLENFFFSKATEGSNVSELANAMGFLRWGHPSKNIGEVGSQFVGKFYDPFEPNYFTQRNVQGVRTLRYVFRCLSPEDSNVLKSIDGGGIQCKQRRNGLNLVEQSIEWLDNAALCHVLHGSSQEVLEDRKKMLGSWISTTKNLGITIKFGGLFQDVALICMESVRRSKTKIMDFEDNDVLKASTSASLQFDKNEKNRIITFARRSQEVLIFDRIPKEAVRILTPQVLACSIWPFCDSVSMEQTLTDQDSRKRLLRKLQNIHGIPVQCRTDALFPRAEDFTPDCLELIFSLGGPNDRTSLCCLRRDLGHLKKGTRYVLKQAKPNLGKKLTKMISDEEMFLQNRLAWIANSLYHLCKVPGSGITAPQACLYEYRATYRDFLAFNYVDAGSTAQGHCSTHEWRGSFLLFRYGDKDMEMFAQPGAFDKAVLAAQGIPDKAFLFDDLVADCIMGVAFKCLNANEGYNSGRLTKRQFAKAADGGLLRLPGALEHALGSKVFADYVERFNDEESVGPMLKERVAASCEPNGGFPTSRLHAALCGRRGWSEMRTDVLQLMRLLDNSTAPSLKDAGCHSGFERCVDLRCLALKGLQEAIAALMQNPLEASPEKLASPEILYKALEAQQPNRVAVLFADPLQKIEADGRTTNAIGGPSADAQAFSPSKVAASGEGTEPPNGKSWPQLTEAGTARVLRKNQALWSRLELAVQSIPDVKIHLRGRVGTLDAVLAAADMHEVLVLCADVHVKRDEKERECAPQLVLESSEELGAADLQDLDRSLSKRLTKISRCMASFLRFHGFDSQPQALDSEWYISIEDMLRHPLFKCGNHSQGKASKKQKGDAERANRDCPAEDCRIRDNADHPRDEAVRQKKLVCTEDEVLFIAEADSRRFQLSECRKRVRALYGHSDRAPSPPMQRLSTEDVPKKCVYRCSPQTWKKVESEGIKCEDRNYIHLFVLPEDSEEEKLRTTSSGAQSRWQQSALRPNHVIVHIDVYTAIEDGYCEFFKGGAGDLIFTTGKDKTLSPKYFKFSTDRDGSLFWNPTLIHRLNHTALKMLVILNQGMLGPGTEWTDALKKFGLTFDIVLVDGRENKMAEFTKRLLRSLADESQTISSGLQEMPNQSSQSKSSGNQSKSSGLGVEDEEIRVKHIAGTKRIGDHRLLSGKAKSKAAESQFDSNPMTMDYFAPPIFGRHQDILSILHQLTSKVAVNVWANAQLGKSAAAIELGTYCSIREPHFNRVLRIDIDESYELESSNVWNYIIQKAVECGLTVKWQSDHDHQSVEEMAESDFTMNGNTQPWMVSLLIIDAGQMSCEGLHRMFESSNFFAQIEECMKGMKIVLFSQEELGWKDDRKGSYQLPALDVKSAVGLYWDERGRHKTSFPNVDLNHCENELKHSDVVALLEKVMQDKQLSSSFILQLARLQALQISEVAQLIQGCDDVKSMEERLCEKLYRFLAPELQHALLACSVTPDLFKVTYLTEFNNWVDDCLRNFWTVELSPAGSFPLRQFGTGTDPYLDRGASVHNWMVKSNVYSARFAGSAGHEMLNSLISRGFIHQVKSSGLNSLSTSSEPSAHLEPHITYHKLSDEMRGFCLKEICRIEACLPEYAMITQQRKQGAIQGLLKDLMQGVASHCGLRDFTLLLKNWRWALDQCILELLEIVDLDVLHSGAGNLYEERVKGMASRQGKGELERRRHVTTARNKEMAYGVRVWLFLAACLLWSVRRVIKNLVPVSSIQFWIGIIMKAGHAIEKATEEIDIRTTFAIAQSHVLDARMILQDYEVTTFEGTITRCEYALAALQNLWHVFGDANTSGAIKEERGTAEMAEGGIAIARAYVPPTPTVEGSLRTRPGYAEICNCDDDKQILQLLGAVKVEALLTKGIVRSWSQSDKTYKEKASASFEEAQRCWSKFWNEAQISDISQFEGTLLWVEITNHRGNLNLYHEHSIPGEEKFVFHEKLLKQFETNKWMQERIPNEYFRCLHNVGTCLLKRAEMQPTNEDERVVHLRKAENCLVTSYQGHKRQLDHKSVRSIVHLCETSMTLLEVRRLLNPRVYSEASERQEDMGDYEFRRQIHCLLKQLFQMGKSRENLPGRFFKYQKQLKQEQWLFTSTKVLIKGECLKELGLAVASIPDTGDHRQFIEAFSKKWPETFRKFVALKTDIFSHYELGNCLSNSINGFVDELVQCYKEKKAMESVIFDLWGQLRFYSLLARHLEVHYPRWSTAAAVDKAELLTEWADGCPDVFAHRFLTDGSRRPSIVGNAFRALLFTPAESARERLLLLSIGLAVNLCMKYFPNSPVTPQAKQPSDSTSPSPTNNRKRSGPSHLRVSGDQPSPLECVTPAGSTGTPQSATSIMRYGSASSITSSRISSDTSTVPGSVVHRLRAVVLVWFGLTRLASAPHSPGQIAPANPNGSPTTSKDIQDPQAQATPPALTMPRLVQELTGAKVGEVCALAAAAAGNGHIAGLDAVDAVHGEAAEARVGVSEFQRAWFRVSSASTLDDRKEAMTDLLSVLQQLLRIDTGAGSSLGPEP